MLDAIQGTKSLPKKTPEIFKQTQICINACHLHEADFLDEIHGLLGQLFYAI